MRVRELSIFVGISQVTSHTLKKKRLANNQTKLNKIIKKTHRNIREEIRSYHL